MVYLGRCRKRKVELGREVKVKVEVFFWGFGLRVGRG